MIAFYVPDTVLGVRKTAVKEIVSHLTVIIPNKEKKKNKFQFCDKI